MAGRPNLLTFSVLAAVAISSIVSGVEKCSVVISGFDKHACESVEEFLDRGCVLMPRDDSISCMPQCLCDSGTKICDLFSQDCICYYEGWKGINCTEPCTSGFFGRNCAYKCYCMNNGICDRFSGRCTCTPGYQGPLCEEKCPNGTHGTKCSNECKCQNDAICHHVDGSCECTAGWMGPVCAEPCLEGTYGINCSETCDCFKNAQCNATTGECIYTDDMFDDDLPSEENKSNDSQENSSISNKNNRCLPGFSGTNCKNRDCPDNKWGQTCSNECKCRNGSYCHPVTGICWCELGWTGEDCSVSLNEAHFEKQIMEEDHSDSHSSLNVPAICVPIASILLIIIAAIVYYKKRSFRNEDKLTLPSSEITYDVLAEDCLIKE